MKFFKWLITLGSVLLCSNTVFAIHCVTEEDTFEIYWRGPQRFGIAERVDSAYGQVVDD
jgi:hypothetical protein